MDNVDSGSVESIPISVQKLVLIMIRIVTPLKFFVRSKAEQVNSKSLFETM